MVSVEVINLTECNLPKIDSLGQGYFSRQPIASDFKLRGPAGFNPRIMVSNILDFMTNCSDLKI